MTIPYEEWLQRRAESDSPDWKPQSERIAALEAEVAELKTDRERLDFVLAQRGNLLSRDGMPLDDREDIDAARKAGA